MRENQPITENRPAPEDAHANTFQHEHSRHRPLWISGAVVAVLVVMTVYVNLSPSRPLKISKETTYITEPIKSDGKQVDYFAAIRQATRPDNAATDENGYRLIVLHLGTEPGTEPAYFAEVCKELGLDAGALRPDMTYREPCVFLNAYVESAQFDEALLDKMPPEDRSRDKVAQMLEQRLQRPWTLDDLPMMARWLEENGPALDLLGRAVRKPTFHIPLVRQNENALLLGVHSPAWHTRVLATGLMARATYRIAVGETDGAIDDIIACQRLGRHIGHGPFALDLLIGIRIEIDADAIRIAGSFEHPPTKEQIERLLSEKDALPPLTEMSDKAISERFLGLDFIQAIAHGEASWETIEYGPPDGLLHKLGTDWNIVARRFNDVFDEIVATGESPLVGRLGPETMVPLMSIRARSEYWAHLLADLFGSGWRGNLVAPHNRACVHRMKQITLAMLLYECEHGMLPPAWSTDAGGNPLHSWRVLLLPYLGHRELHAKIRLDEPWDSEYNRQFHDEPMDVFRCPSHPTAVPGQTTYSVVVGAAMPFEAGKGKRLTDFGPQSDDMILLVERSDPVVWMDPTREVTQESAEQGIDYDASDRAPPAPGRIGNHHPGVAKFGFRNGGVWSVSRGIDRELLGKLLRGTNADKTVAY